MKEININITSVSGKVPVYATDGAAGFDFAANEAFLLRPHETALVGTGICMEIPMGFEVQVRSRSGLACKGIVVANSPGTIDSDYRGEIKVIIRNTTDKEFQINIGDRIAQGILAAVERAAFSLVDNLSETKRNVGGFGSTGVK